MIVKLELIPDDFEERFTQVTKGPKGRLILVQPWTNPSPELAKKDSPSIELSYNQFLTLARLYGFQQ